MEWIVATNAVELRKAGKGEPLFAQVGAFLDRHRLSPVPAHYALAYEVVTRPEGAVARVVDELTEGGIRLTERDVADLSPELAGTRQTAPVLSVVPSPDAAEAAAKQAIDRAMMQIEGFADTITAVHAEANDFGRDLSRSADAIRAADPAAGVQELTRLTAAMIDRVRQSEARLDRARRESEELKAALDEARGSARTDALTELPNRRAFDEAFAALDPAQPVTLVMCDIDHFKRVNDSFGHPVGDRVLRAAAQVLSSEQGYLVARYGGEEFALLFENRTATEAEVVVDRLRELLRERKLKLRESGVPVGPVTFSAGVAHGLAGQGRAAMMTRADGALYVAKARGRACTQIAPELPLEPPVD